MKSLAEVLIHKRETESTNDDLKALVAAGAVEEGAVVMAERQTAGRGRKGAEWFCAEGCGLAFSVLVVPRWERKRWGWVSLAAGLAVAEALEQFGFAPEIKWPNDVWLGGKKCCGILVEAPGEQVVVGVGLNVNGTEFPDGIEATSLEVEGGGAVSRDRVLEAVWRRLLEVMERAPEALAEQIWSRLAWRDVEVEARMDGGTRRGRIRAFGANGELWMESGGELLVISEAGSVRLAE